MSSIAKVDAVGIPSTDWERSRQFYVETIGALDADAVVFACTELGLLLDPNQLDVPVYIHPSPVKPAVAEAFFKDADTLDHRTRAQAPVTRLACCLPEHPGKRLAVVV